MSPAPTPATSVLASACAEALRMIAEETEYAMKQRDSTTICLSIGVPSFPETSPRQSRRASIYPQPQKHRTHTMQECLRRQYDRSQLFSKSWGKKLKKSESRYRDLKSIRISSSQMIAGRFGWETETSGQDNCILSSVLVIGPVTQ